jgi:hypothetical protein
MNNFTLATCLFIFYSLGIDAQQLDMSFGEGGYIESSIPAITGVTEIDNKLLIHNLYNVHSYSLTGDRNMDFGINGSISNPFTDDYDGYLINQCFIYNDKYTISGCHQVPEKALDVNIVQIDPNTGSTLSDFNLSYTGDIYSDEFLTHTIVDDTLRLFGHETYYTTPPFSTFVSNGISATVDINGNVLNPDKAFKILPQEYMTSITYLKAHELNNGKVIHFFRITDINENYKSYLYKITETITEIESDIFDSNLTDFQYLHRGINQIVQLNENEILITSNADFYRASYDKSFILNIESKESNQLFTDFVKPGFRIKDVIISEDNKIFISGSTIEDSYSPTYFVCKVNKDLSIDESFGDNGYFEFDIDNKSLKQEKSFYNNGNLYISFTSENINNETQYLLAKIDLDFTLSTLSTGDMNNSLRISPNPISNFDQLKISSDYDIKKISIYDSVGTLLQSVNSKEEIKNNKLNSGNYFIVIDIENIGTKTYKIIKL